MQYDAEKLDPRGRTPLMLAVRLCHLQSVKVLLTAKCNANAERDGWSVVQEAVCTGDAAILTAILEVRDLQRHIQRVTHVPQLLQKLIEAPDFYVEMKWEFTSWGKPPSLMHSRSSNGSGNGKLNFILFYSSFSITIMSKRCI